MYHQYSNQILM